MICRLNCAGGLNTAMGGWKAAARLRVERDVVKVNWKDKTRPDTDRYGGR